MKIGIDFDGVMNDMIVTWVEWLNRDHEGYSVSPQDIIDWEMSKQYPTLTRDELYAPLNAPEFWDEVRIKHEAPEVVERLIAEGHEVYVVTSSHYRILPFKLDKSLFAHFPYFTKKDVIITYNKSLIDVDLLLDDGIHNLRDFKGIKVIFDASYNQDFEADYRVATWKEFYILVSGLARGNTLNTPKQRVQLFKAGRGQGKTAWLHQMLEKYDSSHCYIIASTQMEFEHFCRSYRERFGKRCPVKLYELGQPLEHDAKLFVDMPSRLPVKSKAFAAFRNVFIDRSHLIFIADFENTYWHVV